MMLDNATPEQVRVWVSLNLKRKCECGCHGKKPTTYHEPFDACCTGGKGWVYPLMQYHSPLAHSPSEVCECIMLSDWHLEDLLAAVRWSDYDMAFNLLSSSPMLNASEPADPREVLEVATLEVARLLKQQLAQEQASEPARKRKRKV